MAERDDAPRADESQPGAVPDDTPSGMPEDAEEATPLGAPDAEPEGEGEAPRGEDAQPGISRVEPDVSG
jgi:hypothetical protein